MTFLELKVPKVKVRILQTPIYRYPALRTISSIYLVLAVIIGFGAIIATYCHNICTPYNSSTYNFSLKYLLSVS